MLKDILTISGKSGLFRLISQGNNMLIVESLQTKERFPVYSHERVSSLHDISMFTTDGDIPLWNVLDKIKEKEAGKPISFDVKKASKDELKNYFLQILPNFDTGRVYPTDIQKAIKWYNILLESGIVDFEGNEQEKNEPKKELTDNTVPDTIEKEKKKNVTKTAHANTKKPATAIAKTGVGTRKG